MRSDETRSDQIRFLSSDMVLLCRSAYPKSLLRRKKSNIGAGRFGKASVGIRGPVM